jgi:septum formation protein
MTRVVLGSASTGRLSVLRGAGIDPVVIVSGVDEDAIAAALGPDASPATVTTALAAAKARAVVDVLPSEVAADCVVIGCDSMLWRAGALWGKPGTDDAARTGWQQMAGGSAELVTGHCVIRVRDGVPVGEFAEHSSTTVHFGTPSADELDAYVRSGEPQTVAGGFTLDGRGGWFVDGVTGDPSAVIGIGLPLMRTLFARAGLSIADLWAANPA